MARIAMRREDTNQLDVFGIGSDCSMWHKAWTGSAWSPGGTT